MRQRGLVSVAEKSNNKGLKYGEILSELIAIACTRKAVSFLSASAASSQVASLVH